MKVLPKKFVFVLLMPFMMAGTAAAQTPEQLDPSTPEGMSVGRCIRKGGHDFGLFWSSVIYNDDLKEGLIEPWKDILNRNQCHAFDVIGLVKQQDALRSMIRDAFLTCDTDQLPQLKTAFHKLTAEIYYVRHIVDGGIVVNLPYDLLRHQFFQKSAVADRTKLYNDMLNKYVDETMLKQDEFDDLFLLLETKYGAAISPDDSPDRDLSEDRLHSYIDGCENASWKAVGEKWAEFKKHFTEDYGGTRELAEGAAQSWSRVADEASKIQIIDVIKGDMGIIAYGQSFGTVNLNGLDFEQGLSEIVDSVTGGFIGATPSTEEFLGALASGEESFRIESTKVEMLNEFSVRYGNVSDETVEKFVNTLDGRLTEDPLDDGFIEILHSTYPQLHNLEEATKTMNDRQCPS